MLGYRPDEIVYKIVDFQTYRNGLHYQIKRNELETFLRIIENDEPKYYAFHNDYVKALDLVATVYYLRKKWYFALRKVFKYEKNEASGTLLCW